MREALLRTRTLRGLGLTCIPLACILCTPGTAAAQPIPKGEWTATATEHFVVYGNAGEAKLREIVVELDQLRQLMALTGSDEPLVGGRPLTIVVFRNEAAFEPYMRTPPTRGTVLSSESYIGADRSWVLLNGTRPPGELRPWAYGAYVSHYLARRHPTLPAWLRHGLSAFYSTAQIESKGTVRLGFPPEQAMKTLREYSLVPLAQFFQLDGSSAFVDTAQGVATWNAQSWLLAHYLMSGGGRDPQRGGAFFRLVTGGVSAEEAVREVFGVDLESFESSLRGYVNSPTLAVFTLKGQTFTEPVAQPVPMDSAEVAYLLGLYLTSAHSPPPVGLVEEHLLPLTKGGSRQADALAVLGELRRQTGRSEAATELFAEAEALGPREASSYYFIAVHYQELDPEGRQEAIRACLKRAIEIDPGFGWAYARLDRAYDYRNAPPEAIANLEAAVRLLPDMPSLPYNLVIRHLNNSDPETARQVVETYLGTPDRTRERRQALDQIAQAERHLKRGRQIDLYNLALSRYNAGDYSAAREPLTELLEIVEDADIERSARKLLEALDLREQS
jgi:tetratricopeptide (TPR) repeat protein